VNRDATVASGNVAFRDGALRWTRRATPASPLQGAGPHGEQNNNEEGCSCRSGTRPASATAPANETPGRQAWTRRFRAGTSRAQAGPARRAPREDESLPRGRKRRRSRWGRHGRRARRRPGSDRGRPLGRRPRVQDTRPAEGGSRDRAPGTEGDRAPRDAGRRVRSRHGDPGPEGRFAVRRRSLAPASPGAASAVGAQTAEQVSAARTSLQVRESE